jgi:hypothetical protein
MTPEQEIKDLKKKITKLEGILFGNDNDPRFQAKVRSLVIDGEHIANKPTIVNRNGKKYKLQTV